MILYKNDMDYPIMGSGCVIQQSCVVSGHSVATSFTTGVGGASEQWLLQTMVIRWP